MSLFRAAIITENDHDGQTPPNDFTGRMLGVDVVNGITEPEKWRDIRRFAAKGFVTGEADSEKMNRLERLAKHGPMPRLPTQEELDSLDVPESFADVAPPHNERVSLMKEEGFNPYEVVSHPNKSQSLAFFWVFEKGAEVLDELEVPGEGADQEEEADAVEQQTSEDESDEESSDEDTDEGSGEDANEEEEADDTSNEGDVQTEEE